jgi:Fe-S cluster assembly protein SufD
MAAVVASPRSAALDAIVARFEAAAAARAPGAESTAVARLRREALERFLAKGIPTVRDEDWKYTNLAALASHAFTPAPAAPFAPSVGELVERARLHLHGGASYVFVDGRFAPAYSSPLAASTGTVEGLRAGSLRDALREAPALVEPHWGAASSGKALADLSTLLADDGFFLHLAQGTCLPVPIEVIHVATTAGAAVFPRMLVVAEAETRATIIEQHVAAPGLPHASFPVTECVLGRNAAIEHVLWERSGDGATFVAMVAATQARDSRFASHVLTLGSETPPSTPSLVRVDVDASLDGEGAETTLNALYLVAGVRHVDLHTRIDHRVPHGTSRELVKGAAADRATAVFNGKVIVRPGAAKTDSRQTNHNLLLSDDATIDTKPELEIDADDVKCAHGATVGRLREDELFYLRSRGIDVSAARALLVRAFARDVTDRISIEGLRARVEAEIDARVAALDRAGALR